MIIALPRNSVIDCNEIVEDVAYLQTSVIKKLKVAGALCDHSLGLAVQSGHE